jgi:lambda repressor-like predicted transcriptional regulator
MRTGVKNNKTERILSIINENAVTLNALSSQSGLSTHEITEILDRLIRDGKIGKIIGGKHERYYQKRST